MTYAPHTHWVHKYIVAEAWITGRENGTWSVDLKMGRGDFVPVKTNQIDRLMKDFELNPLGMGD